MKFLLIISTILFSSLFLVSQNAFATEQEDLYTEWYWVGGTGTSWSETNNWLCLDITFAQVTCPAPGYPALVSGTNDDQPFNDFVFISPQVGGFAPAFGLSLTLPIVVTIDADVFVEQDADIIIENADVTNISDLTLEGSFKFDGPSANTLINSATGNITNTGFFRNAASNTILNSGMIINNPGEFLNEGQIINDCTGVFIGAVEPGTNDPVDDCTNTPPTVTASLVAIDVEDDNGIFQVQFTVTDDTDSNPVVNADINGISVENDQFVELEIDDEIESEFDGILEINAPSFVLTVTATDFDTASTTVTVTPTFVDDEDD